MIVVVVLTAIIGSALLVSPVAAVTETDDTIGIVKESVAPSNAEIAVRLSEGTPLADTSTVVVARDDQFADALASGVLQHDHPMLLVPSTGPIPERVAGELDRLAPDRVIILGARLPSRPTSNNSCWTGALRPSAAPGCRASRRRRRSPRPMCRKRRRRSWPARFLPADPLIRPRPSPTPWGWAPGRLRRAGRSC
ncbi:MAG TPA: cell wall-binding repeat-containing protein [Euzebya sp.]|nr:cell wall-binding repeat-containing protein [Euzebya sp.]